MKPKLSINSSQFLLAKILCMRHSSFNSNFAQGRLLSLEIMLSAPLPAPVRKSDVVRRIGGSVSHFAKLQFLYLTICVK